MTHISEIIEDILVEWAYRVHDGMPNPKNTQHIQQLRESMEELNLPNNVIYQVIQNLINEQTEKLSKQGVLDVLKKHKDLEQQGTVKTKIYGDLEPKDFVKALNQQRTQLSNDITDLKDELKFNGSKNIYPKFCSKRVFVGVDKAVDDDLDDLDLERMWDTAVWNEIESTTNVNYEVEKVTSTAGVRG